MGGCLDVVYDEIGWITEFWAFVTYGREVIDDFHGFSEIDAMPFGEET